MQITKTVAALVAGLSLAIAAQAQEPAVIGKKCPDFLYGDDRTKPIKFDIDDYRGWYVVFYFWRTNNLESVQMYQKFYGEQGKYKQRGVRFIAFCTDTKQRVEDYAKEKSFEQFELQFFGRAFSELFLATHEPFVVIIDPLGTILWRGDAGNRFTDRLDYFIQGMPALASDEKYIGMLFRDAEKAESAKELGKAYSYARFVSHITEDGGQENTRAKSLMDKLEGAAATWLKDAIAAQNAGDLEKAAHIVAQISVRFGRDPDEDDGTRRQRPGGDRNNQQNNENEQEQKSQLIKDTEAEAGRMFGDRKLREIIQKEVKNARGELANEWAEQLERRELFEKAREVYKRNKDKFKETEAGKAAEAAYERMTKDKKINQAIETARNEEMAWRHFDLGERYQAAELYDTAREHFEKVIKDYPKARIASWAKEKLEKLPKGDAKSESASATPGKEKAGTP